MLQATVALDSTNRVPVTPVAENLSPVESANRSIPVDPAARAASPAPERL